MSKQIGDEAERVAKAFLIKRGLRWIMSNYHCRFGEIDLIMQEDDYLVFIEVRQRRSMRFGGALESIHRDKQRKMILSAQQFQQAHKQWSDVPCRIDVLTLQGEPPVIDWIKNAIFNVV